MTSKRLTTRKKHSSTSWTPRRYQSRAIRWLAGRPHGALLLDPGLGKTSLTLKLFDDLRKKGEAKRVLVIAPKRVCYTVWTHEAGGELARWRDTFGHLKVALLHGSKKTERLEGDADIYVMNFDGLQWLISSGGLLWLIKKKGVNVLLIDELSKFKHTRTKRFKLLKPYLKRFKHRWGLTGSPVPNGLIDLFGQIYVMDQGQALGQYITHYRHKYFLPTGYGGYQWKLQEGAEKRIYKALKPIALSMKAEDHLDLPTLVVRDLYVDLPKQARQTYTTLEEELVAYVDQEVVTAANAAVASGKCRQVASGGLYAVNYDPLKPYAHLGEFEPGSKRRVHHLHDGKTEALVELVEELQGSPLLVAYEFHHDLRRIRDALGDVPAINGDTKDKDLPKLVQAWNNGELPVLCGHPAAMAHGLNLQERASHVCWYSLTWNLEHYDQLIRRVWRQGSTAKRVMVHRLIARDTVDEVIAGVLNQKKRRQDSLMKALKAYTRSKRK